MLKSEIIEENGVSYIVETYENGTKVKSVFYEEPITPPEPEPQPLSEMSDTEQAIFETQANTEYLIALSELQ